MKYENKKEVDKLCSEIGVHEEMYRNAKSSTSVGLMHNHYAEVNILIENKKGDEFNSLLSDKANVFQAEVLTIISDKIASLKVELKKL